MFGSGVFPHKVLLVDTTSNLHPFFIHMLDAGPLRLATIAHAFNYQVAVLRDGVRSATRVGRSRRVEGRILEDTDVSWGHQVAVMFQIVSALALEVPAFLQNIEDLRGVSPDVQLSCEPWGHVVGVVNASPRIVRVLMFMHGLSLMPKDCVPVSELEDVSVSTGGSGARTSHVTVIGAGRPGSVSHQPCANGRLLLAVYVRWKTGMLVTSDWLRHIARCS